MAASSTRSSRPSTAGISRARAKMALWEVGPPLPSTMPATLAELSTDTAEGESSSASSTVPGCKAEKSISGRPSSRRSIPPRKSRTSAARWRVTSSSAAVNKSMNKSQEAERAASADWPEAMRPSTWPFK